MHELHLYGRADCHLCEEARDLVGALLTERASAGLPVPMLVEHDIDADAALQRAFFDRIPVVELGGCRLELVTSATKIRRLLVDVLDTAGAAGATR
jgi:hypothetical protein